MDKAIRFTIAKLLIATVLINIAVCLTFAVPFEIGFPILTFISLVVLPPMIIVGVVNTRGARQAFFLGCMFAGIGHFIVSVWIFIAFAFGQFGGSSDFKDLPKYIHLAGYAIGLMGGLSGVGMFYLVTTGQRRSESNPAKLTSKPEESESWFNDPNEFHSNSDELANESYRARSTR